MINLSKELNTLNCEGGSYNPFNPLCLSRIIQGKRCNHRDGTNFVTGKMCFHRGGGGGGGGN